MTIARRDQSCGLTRKDHITPQDYRDQAQFKLSAAKKVLIAHLSGLGAASDYPIDTDVASELETVLDDIVLASVNQTMANTAVLAQAERIRPVASADGTFAETIAFAEQRSADIAAETAVLAAERGDIAAFLDELKCTITAFRTRSGAQLTPGGTGPEGAPVVAKGIRREETERTMPADWKPDDKQVFSLVEDLKLSADEVGRAAVVFRGEMIGSGEKKTRWGAVFRAWLSVPGNSPKYKVAATVREPQPEEPDDG